VDAPEDDDERKAMTTEQLSMFLRVVDRVAAC
jgi:hypothetical protein